MSLLGVTPADDQRAWRFDRSLPGRTHATGVSGEARLDAGDDAVVVEVACRGDHQVHRVVVLGVEGRDLVASHRLDRLAGADRLPPERVVGEQRFEQQRVDELVGIVLVHEQLFEDDLPLGVDLEGAERRCGDDIGQQFEAEVELPRRQPRVVRGVLLGGEGVHLASDRVDRLGDLAGAARLGALEQQVLQEVRCARHLGGLVAAAHRDPEAGGDRARLGHPLGDDADARGQHGAADLLVGRRGGAARRWGAQLRPPRRRPRPPRPLPASALGAPAEAGPRSPISDASSDSNSSSNDT